MSVRSSGLSVVLRKLWINFNRGVSVRNSYLEYLLKDDFVYPEVCAHTIKYWYWFFLENPTRFTDNFSFMFINFDEYVLFLSALIIENPAWTTAHYMDALKVSSKSIYYYMKYLGYSYTDRRWIKNR
ncbi:hypothetical protein M0802_016044 [Mischocyttarus mexicanus]|nr:hypothetical protein M0802_016044 [Mischocyttarus mexicanus]